MPRKKIIQDDQTNPSSNWQDPVTQNDQSQVVNSAETSVNIDFNLDDIKIDSLDDTEQTKENVSDISSVLMDETLNTLEKEETTNAVSFDLNLNFEEIEWGSSQDNTIKTEETVSVTTEEETTPSIEIPQEFSFDLNEVQAEPSSETIEPEQTISLDTAETSVEENPTSQAEFNISGINFDNEENSSSTEAMSEAVIEETTTSTSVEETNIPAADISFNLGEELTSQSTENTVMTEDENSKNATSSSELWFDLNSLNSMEEVPTVSVETNSTGVDLTNFLQDSPDTPQQETIKLDLTSETNWSAITLDSIGTTFSQLEDKVDMVEEKIVQETLTQVESTPIIQKKKKSSLIGGFVRIIGTFIVIWWLGVWALWVHDVMEPDSPMLGDVLGLVGLNTPTDTQDNLVVKRPNTNVTKTAKADTWVTIENNSGSELSDEFNTWSLTTTTGEDFALASGSVTSWSNSLVSDNDSLSGSTDHGAAPTSWDNQESTWTWNETSVSNSSDTSLENALNAKSTTSNSDIEKLTQLQTQAKKLFVQAKSKENKEIMVKALKSYKAAKALSENIKAWADIETWDIQAKINALTEYLEKTEKALNESSQTEAITTDSTTTLDQ